MANFDKSKIEKIIGAESAEALKALAKANGIEMSDEDAKISFDQLKSGMSELKDEELDNVAGGIRDTASALELTSLKTSSASASCLMGASVIGSAQTNLCLTALMSNSSTNKCLLELMNCAAI